MVGRLPYLLHGMHSQRGEIGDGGKKSCPFYESATDTHRVYKQIYSVSVVLKFHGGSN